MQLPQTVEYAFRAMTCLAVSDDDAPVRAGDLADRVGVPRPYLAKVMRRLVVAGLVDSRKGKHGGYRLARPRQEVVFADILRAMDVEPVSDRCAFGLHHCDPERPCPMHEAWSRLNRTFNDWARSHTLADVQREASGGWRTRPRDA